MNDSLMGFASWGEPALTAVWSIDPFGIVPFARASFSILPDAAGLRPNGPQVKCRDSDRSRTDIVSVQDSTTNAIMNARVALMRSESEYLSGLTPPPHRESDHLHARFPRTLREFSKMPPSKVSFVEARTADIID